MRGKTRSLWEKNATGGLKPESHPCNYRYRRKKYFHYVREWGVLLGDTGSSSQADSPMGRKSNLRIPSLNETFTQNAKDVGTPDTKLS